MPDAHANFAASSVAVAPSPATSGVTLTVQTGDGALFPAPPFNCLACPAGAPPRASTAEIVRVTGLAGDVFTLTRGPQAADPGGINRSIVVGDQFFLAMSKKTFTDIESPVPIAVSADVPAPLIGPTYLYTGSHTHTLPTSPADGSECPVVSMTGTVTINRGGANTIYSYGVAGLTTLSLPAGCNVTLKFLAGVWYVIAGQPAGAAPWLSLPSPKQLAINVGIATVTWAAGVSTATATGIAHGLGRTPIAVVASVNAFAGGAIIAAQVGPYTATTFDLELQWVNLYVPGAGYQLGCAWIAVG